MFQQHTDRAIFPLKKRIYIGDFGT